MHSAETGESPPTQAHNRSMYYAIILGCFFVFPVISILIEYRRGRSRCEAMELSVLILRWFTFWIAGVRLLTAGLMQAFRPEFTAETIFDTTDPEVLPFVSELGYTNIAIGLIGVISIRVSTWTPPAALAGGVFLGLAGIRHLADGGAFTADRALAAGTDLFALVILLGALIVVTVQARRSADPAAPR